MNQKQVCEKFYWWQRSQFRSYKETAAYFGVHPSFISQVCTARKPPNEAMLKTIGMKAVISYEPLELLE